MWATILVARFLSITFKMLKRKSFFSADSRFISTLTKFCACSLSLKNHSSTHDERIVYVVCPCESPFSVEGVYAKWGANKLQEVNIFCLRKWRLKRGRGRDSISEETQIYRQFPLTTCSIQLIGDSRENVDPKRSP